MNWTGRLAEIFVRNGRLSLLLVGTLFAWGALAFLFTPKQYNPKITAPAFQIHISLPGASREEVLEQVTKPLENVLADIPGVDDIYSVTKSGGSADVTVNFEVGRDPDSAKVTLNDKIESNLNLAPLGIEPPRIRSIDPDDVPVMTLALHGSKRSPVELRKLAFRLRERLALVPGASNVEVIGGRRQELAVLIDPDRLAGSGVGISDIEAALRRNNIFAPAGPIKDPDQTIALETQGAIASAEALRSVAVVTGDFGQIRLGDVARVESRVREVESYVRHRARGGPALGDQLVLLSIAKRKGTNISDVTEAVRARMSDLSSHVLPADVKLEVLVDEGEVAHSEIMGLVLNLFTAVAIVVAVLFVFLDARAAFLTAISIPLTLAVVFGIAQITGQNINRITLFALILSLGLLVDNATVVIENIVRRLGSAGSGSRIDRILSAVSEVGPGLFMSTVTTVLAFIPMAFVTGMMGPYMGPIPFFVPAAILVSLLIAFSLNPWMASVILREKSEVANRSSLLPEWTASAADRLSGFGAWMFAWYRRFLHSLLVEPARRRRVLAGIGLLLVLALILPGVGLVRFRMLPKADRAQFFLYVDLPEGTPVERTLRVTEGFRDALLADPRVRMAQSYVGRPPILDFNGLFRGTGARSGSHEATMRVGFVPAEARPEKSEAIVAQLRPKLQRIARDLAPDGAVRIKLVEDPPGPPVLSTLVLRVRGYDSALLAAVARHLEPRIAAVEGVTDLDDSLAASTKTITVRVRHERASRSRISTADIAGALAAAYGGRVIGIHHSGENIEQEFVHLQMDRAFREKASDLRRISLYNDVRIRVSLADLVDFVDAPAVSPRRRENRLDTVYVFGEMSGRSITYAAIDILSLLWDYRLPDGKGEVVRRSLFGIDYRTADGREVEVSLGGEWELTLEVFRDLGLAMGVAIFLIYVVLTAQFGSFRDPLIVMSTIPLSLIGVLPAFLVLGWTIDLYFNATSMIGVIALAGIAVNNSIILLEYVNDLRRGGMGLEEALVEAGSTRFRPILLTTATTMLGSLTIVSDPVWAGLAYAIIAGLGVSSLLTLIVFPVLYYMVRAQDWRPIDA